MRGKPWSMRSSGRLILKEFSLLPEPSALHFMHCIFGRIIRFKRYGICNGMHRLRSGSGSSANTQYVGCDCRQFGWLHMASNAMHPIRYIAAIIAIAIIRCILNELVKICSHPPFAPVVCFVPNVGDGHCYGIYQLGYC